MGLLVIAVVMFVLFVDANAYKPRLEAAAADALGMEVRIHGRVKLGFLPGLRVHLDDIDVRRRGAAIATVADCPALTAAKTAAAA